MTPRQTPQVVIPATFPIGGSYHCITRRVIGTPYTTYTVYRTIDSREIGRQISWPSGDDARNMEHHYEAWLRATKGRCGALEDWTATITKGGSARGSTAQKAAGWAA